jgi:hypothetical protein
MPAHLYTHCGTDGNVSGKSYFPQAEVQKTKWCKRTTYTVPPMKGPKPAKRGTKALYEVKYYQRETNLLVPKDPMERLIREVAQRDLEKVSHFT